MNINQDRNSSESNESRNSHWPIYDVIPLELIKVISDTVREAPKNAPEGFIKGNESKDGLVVYFPSREKERG